MLNDLLALSHVPRWGIVKMARPQTVADHSFRVAAITFELTAKPEYMAWALVHDIGESRSGDIPSSFKDDYIRAKERGSTPWPRRLNPSPEAERMVKLADLIETTTFATMYGQGCHASKVSDQMTQQTLNYGELLGLRDLTSTLLDDIIGERGR